jgi:YD repeat-containing protein
VTPQWQEFSYTFSSTATTTDKITRLLIGLGYTSNDTYWIDDVELIPDTLSSIKAPSFENSTSVINANWNVYIDQLSYGSNSVDCTTATDGSCSEKITSNIATTTDWIINMYQYASTSANQTYVLTFDAKASLQRDANVYLQQNYGAKDMLSDDVPYTIYTTWNHYAIELTADATDSGQIDFANSGAATRNIWFDNIHLVRKQATKVTAPPPVFTGIYDSSGSSTASAYQIQVITRGGDWSSPLWDSGKTTISPQTHIGSRTATSTYAGPSLPADGTDAQKYYWRMKVWDSSNNPSPWTNGNDFFMTPGNRVQDLTYTYDADGNITHLVDGSYTKTAKTVDYTYDALNRLTKASTTPAIDSGAPNAGGNVTEAWTYDALGNILTDATTTGGVTSTSTYIYAGNTGSSYADPDAATQVGNDSLTYDKNGDTLTGFGLTNVFDWRNRLATTTGPATSSTATTRMIAGYA